MKNLQLLDSILLSENVVKRFYEAYINNEFKSWLNNIIPEVEKCNTTTQDNPWHIYNCLVHILHSVEEINKQSINLDYNTRRVLAYTMFFHDMGKPATKIRRFSKLYDREVDSFFNHNKVSTAIAKRTLPQLGFNKTDSKIIQQLVYKHDIFMFITLSDDNNPHHKVLTNQLLVDEIDSFNKLESVDKKTLMDYLIMVGRADNLAQNPQMTHDSLTLLNTMKTMLNGLELGKTV